MIYHLYILSTLIIALERPFRLNLSLSTKTPFYIGSNREGSDDEPNTAFTCNAGESDLVKECDMRKDCIWQIITSNTWTESSLATLG